MRLAAALEHLAAVAPRGEACWAALRSLGPAFAAHPEALARLSPPRAIADAWQRDLRATRARNVLLLAELDRAFEALDAAGVPAVAFKGAAALDRLYDDPGLRPMDDADLLVHPSDSERAAESIARLGYTRRADEPGRFGHAGQDEWTFDGPIQIDLHWHVVADRRLRALFPGCDDGTNWLRAVGRRLAPIDDALATAIAQPLGHPWSHPLGYLDLHLALDSIDAAELFERARQRGVGQLLWWSVRFAAQLFGGEPPPASLAPQPSARRLGDLLVGGDWLGVAPFRREMPARDLFVVLLAGRRVLRGSVALGRGGDPRGAARVALSLARTAARALAS
jgi:hypothetical protein